MCGQIRKWHPTEGSISDELKVEQVRDDPMVVDVPRLWSSQWIPFVDQRPNGGTHSKVGGSGKLKGVLVLYDLMVVVEPLWREARLLVIADERLKEKFLEESFSDLLAPKFEFSKGLMVELCIFPSNIVLKCKLAKRYSRGFAEKIGVVLWFLWQQELEGKYVMKGIGWKKNQSTLQYAITLGKPKAVSSCNDFLENTIQKNQRHLALDLWILSSQLAFLRLVNWFVMLLFCW